MLCRSLLKAAVSCVSCKSSFYLFRQVCFFFCGVGGEFGVGGGFWFWFFYVVFLMNEIAIRLVFNCCALLQLIPSTPRKVCVCQLVCVVSSKQELSAGAAA